MHLKGSNIPSNVGSAFCEIQHTLKVVLFTLTFHSATVKGLLNEENGKVYWALMTYPVVFGEDAMLTCVINDKSMPCSKDSNRMWEGGPGGKLLLLNGTPSNHDKYREESQNPCLNFSLVIRSITEFDVNCKYRCSIGFEESQQQELAVNETFFISLPNKQSTHNLTVNESAIDLNINLYQVYPIPKCKMVVGSSSVDVKKLRETRKDMFYDVMIHATQTLEQICSYCWQTVAVEVHCSLNRMSVFNLTKNFNCSYEKDCIESTDKTVTTDSLHRLTTTFTCIIVTILVVASVCSCIVLGISKKRKLFTKRSTDKETELRERSLLTDT